jgi:5-methyltetrahydropteroyltriglutamate--homocysteine methyltransferase
VAADTPAAIDRDPFPVAALACLAEHFALSICAASGAVKQPARSLSRAATYTAACGVAPREVGRMGTSSWQDQPLLTTVVGSYPTGGLPPRRALQRAVEDQIAAGVELISDGQVRGDMVATFAERIPGFERSADGGWVVRAELEPPETPIAASDYLLARRLAAGRAMVKGVVTGPVTLALACRVGVNSPYVAPQDPALILKLAEIMAHEVAALVAAGAEVVQVDEPALATERGRLVSAELLENALRDLAALPACPVLHVCGDVRGILDELLALPFRVLDIEGARVEQLERVDRDQLEYCDARVAYGCVDTQSAEIEPVRVIRERVERAIATLGSAERLWVSPDCGLRQLAPDAARGKLAAMVEAVQDVRARL